MSDGYCETCQGKLEKTSEEGIYILHGARQCLKETSDRLEDTLARLEVRSLELLSVNRPLHIRAEGEVNMEKDTRIELTEEQVREIVREEIERYLTALGQARQPVTELEFVEVPYGGPKKSPSSPENQKNEAHR